MVERLERLPSKCFIVQDGSKIYAARKGELFIFEAEVGTFNQMTEHQLKTFIRKNAKDGKQAKKDGESPDVPA